MWKFYESLTVKVNYNKRGRVAGFVETINTTFDKILAYWYVPLKRLFSYFFPLSSQSTIVYHWLLQHTRIVKASFLHDCGGLPLVVFKFKIYDEKVARTHTLFRTGIFVEQMKLETLEMYAHTHTMFQFSSSETTYRNFQLLLRQIVSTETIQNERIHHTSLLFNFNNRLIIYSKFV